MAEHQAKLDEVLAEAVSPDTAEWETFKVGDKEFQIRPLTFKWDKVWRKHALPVLGAELRPLEVLLAAIVGNRAEFTADDVGFTRALVDSEIEADTYISKAVAAICASQDPESAKAADKTKQVEIWAERLEETLTRAEIAEILRKQSAIQKDIDQLGKSLSARFSIIAKLAGDKFDIASLLLGGKQPVSASSVPTGTSV